MGKTLFALPLLVLSATGFAPCDMLNQDTPDASAAVDGGDTGECGTTTCVNQLSVEIVRSDNDVFLAGAYSFSLYVAADAAAGTIAGEYLLDCEYGEPGGAMTCYSGDLEALLAVVDASGTLMQLLVAGVPPRATLVVVHDGMEVGRRDLAPAYASEYPNGPACPAGCSTATASMAVEPW